MPVSILIKRVVFTLVGIPVIAFSGLGVAEIAGVSPLSSTKVDRSQPVLLKSVQDLSQLHGALGNFEVVVDFEDKGSWAPEFLSGRRTLFVAAGTVNAYVDLSDLAENDLVLSPDGKSVTVNLPDPQLDKPNLDLDRSYVFEERRGVLTRIADAVDAPEQNELYQLAEAKIAAGAEESDLKETAAKNTRAILTGMLGGLGIEAVFTEEAPGWGRVALTGESP